MEKLIITGAAGFIGTNLARQFSSIYDVILVDRLASDERWKNLVGIDMADYVDADQLFQKLDWVQSVRAVIHMGACSSTTETDVRYLLDNNFEYSKQLFTWCAKNEVPFIYASSAATYGDGSNGYIDDESQLIQLEPLNAYGLSKHLFDLWQLRQYVRPLQVVGLKFFNVYGPYEKHKGAMASVAFHSYQQILENHSARLFKSYHPTFTDGEQMRDFIYISDVVNVVEYFLQNVEKQGIFNVGTGQARTFNDLIKAVFMALGKEQKIEYIAMPESLRGKYQYFTEATIDKLRTAGYKQEFKSIEDGIRDYVEFLKRGM